MGLSQHWAQVQAVFRLFVIPGRSLVLCWLSFDAFRAAGKESQCPTTWSRVVDQTAAEEEMRGERSTMFPKLAKPATILGSFANGGLLCWQQQG